MLNRNQKNRNLFCASNIPHIHVHVQRMCTCTCINLHMYIVPEVHEDICIGFLEDHLTHHRLHSLNGHTLRHTQVSDVGQEPDVSEVHVYTCAMYRKLYKIYMYTCIYSTSRRSLNEKRVQTHRYLCVQMRLDV